ncbi:hypothetical protein GQ600_15867 [Phytophthora cactorum]|nr:hypothetical protein GQ600_15867 [Phytophthora cactorum]
MHPAGCNEVQLLAHGGAVSTTAINTQETEKGTAKETRFLRLDAADSANQEERNLNVGFLKKFLPGTSAFKEANALRAPRKAAKKAQEAAKKQEAVEKWFAPFKNEDHLFKVAFPAWKKEEWATVDILNYFAKNGKTGGEVTTIANRYHNFDMTAPQKRPTGTSS